MERRDAERSLNVQVAQLVRDAEQCGLCVVPQTESQRTRMVQMVQKGALERVFPGMFVSSATAASWKLNPRLRAWTLAKTYAHLHPDRALCSFSAAVVHGLWVSYSLLDKVYVVATQDEATHRSPWVFYRRIKSLKTERVEGIVVTAIEQTVLDCALSAPFAEGLAIADSALRYRGVTNEQLLAYFRVHGKRRPGIHKAMAVARYACGDAENGGESIVRGLIIAAGYMAPSMLQLEFIDPVDITKTIRADGFFDLGHGRGVIFEVDGMVKYPGAEHEDAEGAVDPDSSGEVHEDLRETLVAERQRESHITALGYPVMRVLFKRVREPGYLVSLLRAYGIPQVNDPLPFV